MARYLNPKVPILCRSSSVRHKEHLQDLDSVTIIDPFEILAQLIRLVITNPSLQNLNSWLVGARGTELGRALQVPKGRWILCGYGRMGQGLHKQFDSAGIEACVIESRMEQDIDVQRVVMSEADYDALRESGVEHAVGIIAGTNRDASNLGILMSARRLNPNVFTVVRQNHHENQPVFDAARASYIVQTSLTTARRILKYLISPLVQALIDDLVASDEQKTARTIERLMGVVGTEEPHLWQLALHNNEAKALCERLDTGDRVRLRDLFRNPIDLDASLQCVPLVVQRGSRLMMLPTDDERVERNDVILFCGTERSKRLLQANVNNHYTLRYLLTGIDPPRGYFFAWIARRRSTSATAR